MKRHRRSLRPVNENRTANWVREEIRSGRHEYETGEDQKNHPHGDVQETSTPEGGADLKLAS